MRHSRAQQPSKLDLLFQLIRKPAVASLRQSTLRHALVSRLLILLKAAGDSCPILALADEDPWMGWQLVSDVVSGRSESTLKARLGYLERYFAWCSDHRLTWVPLTVSATWKWMQALKDASPSAPTSGYQSLRWFAHMFQCAADADFFSSPLLKGSATHSLQAAPPLRQKPTILVSQVKRLELLTDSDEPALVNIVGGILVALYSRSRWMDLQRASSSMPRKGSLTSGTPFTSSTQVNIRPPKAEARAASSYLSPCLFALGVDAIGSRTGWLRGIALASQSRELSPHH